VSDTASLHIRQPHPSSQRRPSCSHTLVYLICVVVFIHEQWQLQSLLLPALPPPNHHRVETPEIRFRCQQRHFHINPLSPHTASGLSPRKITAVFAAIFATCNRCIWRLHGGNRRWDINTHYTLILAVRRQSPCSSSSSGSSFSLSHSFATDFRRLFSNIIDNNRRPCAPGCTPAHGRWVRRAI